MVLVRCEATAEQRPGSNQQQAAFSPWWNEQSGQLGFDVDAVGGWVQWKWVGGHGQLISTLERIRMHVVYDNTKGLIYNCPPPRPPAPTLDDVLETNLYGTLGASLPRTQQFHRCVNVYDTLLNCLSQNAVWRLYGWAINKGKLWCSSRNDHTVQWKWLLTIQ